MRKMRMEVEGSDASEPASGVEVSKGVQGSDLICVLDGCRAQSVAILNGHDQPLHHGERIAAEALLSRHERIAVVGVLHCAFLKVGGDADVVMRTEDKTGSLALEKLSNGFDLIGRRFLLSDHVIEAEDHEGVGVGENALVNGQSLTSLIDSLVDGDRLPGCFADELLEL